jgi:hypothetical protein
VKKIINILVALGLVLALGVMATPASADVTPATVTALVPPFCAGETETYIITFDVTADLAEGGGAITIDFPDATDVSAISGITVTWDTFVDVAVPAAWISTAAGAVVTFYVPMHIVVGVENTVTVKIAGVKNPPPGTYTLDVNTSAPVDSTPVASNPYTVVPYTSTYDFMFDFSPTYPGLLPGFVPPFKACGQEQWGYWCEEFGGAYYDIFTVNLITTQIGCNAPCDTATMWFVLEECPPGEVVTFDFDHPGAFYILDETDVGIVQPLPDVTLAPDLTISWVCILHFSSPGNYKICFYLECPEIDCGPGEKLIADECLEAEVYQFKEAWYIELCPKWNLISLPLYPFNTDITAILAPLSAPDQLMSVWYFDQCTDPDPNVGTWYSHPGTLLTMEAGKAYWVRMKHPGDPGYNPALFPAFLWVWGVNAPMPPDSMALFEVCEGWNMVGFKPPWTCPPGVPNPELDQDYLWNWWDTSATWPDYGTIYEWDATTQTWSWGYPWNYVLWPGLGYWIPFEYDGEIYPKA